MQHADGVTVQIIHEVRVVYRQTARESRESRRPEQELHKVPPIAMADRLPDPETVVVQVQDHLAHSVHVDRTRREEETRFLAQLFVGWNGMGWDGMGWDGMGWVGRHPHEAGLGTHLFE